MQVAQLCELLLALGGEREEHLPLVLLPQMACDEASLLQEREVLRDDGCTQVQGTGYGRGSDLIARDAAQDKRLMERKPCGFFELFLNVIEAHI